MSARLLSTGQAARLCAVTPDTVLKWIRSGKLPAQRTPGGHHRVDVSDLRRILEPVTPGGERPQDAGHGLGPRSFSYCWEYYAGADGEVRPGCEECLVYATRAQRCYEVARLAPGTGHVMSFCEETCEDCDYYRHVVGQATNVLVVSDDSALTGLLEREQGRAPFNLELVDCEYACSALVDSFRPDFAIVDCALGPGHSRDIRRHLGDDPRIPLVRLVLTAAPGGFPAECEQEVFALLEKPFSVEEITACIRGIPNGGRAGNVWTSGAGARRSTPRGS